jgi:low temperature requirement protein LtrA
VKPLNTLGLAHRGATPLELLFDLTFATSFSLAASHFAEELAAGRYAAALLGFGFASVAICWAWINFSWFSSAYDTDDWFFRLVTMVQMVGVLVLAIGLPRMFASIEQRQHLDNSIMVLGYVIVRVALVFQWLRAAKQDPARRRVCLTYAACISIAQVGWVVQIAVPLTVTTAPSSYSSKCSARCPLSVGPEVRRGTHITSPNGTVFSQSLRWARAWSARWQHCRP